MEIESLLPSHSIINPRRHGGNGDSRRSPSILRATKPKILALLEPILLGGFLGVLRVLAVNAVTPFHRQDAKDAKKTPSKAIWLRLCRSRFSWNSWQLFATNSTN